MNKIQAIIGFTAVTFLSGCASTKINMAEYRYIPLQKAAVLPSPDEVAGKPLKVVIFNPESGDIPLANTSRAAHTISSTLEKYMSKAGAEIIDRNLAVKLKKEIQLAEIQGTSDYTGPKISDYSVSGTISSANVGSSFSEARQWQDKKGKWHTVAASCSFSAEISANMKIYKLPSLTYVKSINIRGTSSNSHETRNSNCPIPSNQQNSMIRRAAESAVKSNRIAFQTFFAPKAYVLERRTGQKGDIFKLTQGSKLGFNTGSSVTIYNSQKSTNPLSGEVTNEDYPVTEGLISDNVGTKHAWVIVDDKNQADNIKLGDFVKVKFQKNFLEGFGDSFGSLGQ